MKSDSRLTVLIRRHGIDKTYAEVVRGDYSVTSALVESHDREFQDFLGSVARFQDYLKSLKGQQ